MITVALSLVITNSTFTTLIYAQEQQYSLIKKWGSQGTGFGKFSRPADLAIDSSGNLYVTDISSVSNKIQKFDSNGTFITSWGTAGTSPSGGTFSSPTGIDVNSSDNVYVADFGSPNTAVQVFTSNGTFITSWGSVGSGDGQFTNPASVALDSKGHVYVVDLGENNRIQKFDNKGNFITKWGTTGSADGQFLTPVAIAIDSSDNVYVIDRSNNRVQKFDSNGQLYNKMGNSWCWRWTVYYTYRDSSRLIRECICCRSG